MLEADNEHAALLARLRATAARPGLDLLVLFGSRARGDFRADSDWDFGYQAVPDFDPLALAADLGRVLATDRIDLADLRRAGGLLRYRAARDGRVVLETRPGLFEDFWLAAVGFWCDAAAILAPAHEGVLERLGP